MFNFFRHVERRMPQVACCFDMLLVWTGLKTLRPQGRHFGNWQHWTKPWQGCAFDISRIKVCTIQQNYNINT